jgi:hypothetical protein
LWVDVRKFEKQHKDTVNIFSYMIDLDNVTLEMKLLVAEYRTSVISLRSVKLVLAKINISHLGL